MAVSQITSEFSRQCPIRKRYLVIQSTPELPHWTLLKWRNIRHAAGDVFCLCLSPLDNVKHFFPAHRSPVHLHIHTPDQQQILCLSENVGQKSPVLRLGKGNTFKMTCWHFLYFYSYIWLFLSSGKQGLFFYSCHKEMQCQCSRSRQTLQIFCDI